MDRRALLKTLALSGAGFAFAATRPVLAAPPSRIIRVRGRVLVGGRPRAGVPLSDGLDVVCTDRDGTYELTTNTRRSFVQVCLPSDARVPISPSGTAHCYRALTPDAQGDVTADFTLDTLDGDPNRHALLLLADPQIQDAHDVARLNAESVPDLRDTVARLSDRHPFAVACGDIAYDDLDLFADWERALHSAGLPGFQVVGNHDVDSGILTDHASARTFRRRFGPAWYSFDRGEVHVVVLDDVFTWGRYMGYLDRDQLDWLAADLARVEAGRTVLVCMHIPSWSTLSDRYETDEPSNRHVVVNRELLYELLAPYQAMVLAGHMHELDLLRDGGVDVHVCGALCGAWWEGDVCGDGTPNGYMVYEIDGPSVRWRYKSTGFGDQHQIRAYAPGDDPERPDEFIANVWAADPQWRIVWYADGEPRGMMKQFRGLDPRARRLYTGDERPARHRWVEPIITDHLFSCRPEPGTRKVTVEATDRWGRVSLTSVVL